MLCSILASYIIILMGKATTISQSQTSLQKLYCFSLHVPIYAHACHFLISWNRNIRYGLLCLATVLNIEYFHQSIILEVLCNHSESLDANKTLRSSIMAGCWVFSIA